MSIFHILREHFYIYCKLKQKPDSSQEDILHTRWSLNSIDTLPYGFRIPHTTCYSGLWLDDRFSILSHCYNSDKKLYRASKHLNYSHKTRKCIHSKGCLKSNLDSLVGIDHRSYFHWTSNTHTSILNINQNHKPSNLQSKHYKCLMSSIRMLNGILNIGCRYKRHNLCRHSSSQRKPHSVKRIREHKHYSWLKNYILHIGSGIAGMHLHLHSSRIHNWNIQMRYRSHMEKSRGYMRDSQMISSMTNGNWYSMLNWCMKNSEQFGFSRQHTSFH